MCYYLRSQLPPADLTPCGRLTATPEQFYLSACVEANRLENDMQLAEKSTILDIGCGAGRLPIGLLALKLPFQSYLGVDVDHRRTKWCNKYLGRVDSRLSFQFVKIKNARYNPYGGYSRENWESMVQQADLQITKVVPEVNVDGQTAYYLERRTQSVSGYDDTMRA